MPRSKETNRIRNRKRYAKKIGRTPRPKHVIKDGRKICPQCGLDLAVSEFYYTGKQIQSWCKECVKKWNRKRNASPEGQEVVRTHRLKKLYGISPADYTFLLLAVQNGVCVICGKTPQKERRLPVDHDHTSKKVRGILCDFCNTALGKFQDDPRLLRRAALYLEAGGSAGIQVADLVAARLRIPIAS